VRKKAEESMTFWLNQVKHHVYSWDFRWSKRRHGKQGTGTLIDPTNRKVVAICSPTKKLATTSQSMEGYATTIVFRRLKQKDLSLFGVVHDKCMCLQWSG